MEVKKKERSEMFVRCGFRELEYNGGDRMYRRAIYIYRCLLQDYELVAEITRVSHLLGESLRQVRRYSGIFRTSLYMLAGIILISMYIIVIYDN